jgi:hypothetical protein
MTTHGITGDGRILPLNTQARSPDEGSRNRVRRQGEPPRLELVEAAEPVRADRVQEARARIARRFYDQEEVRKAITRSLLAFFGLEEVDTEADGGLGVEEPPPPR